jgi:uncharacterized protein YecT (DUF1311 family)
MKLVYLVILSLCCVMPSYAEEPAGKDPIDVAMEAAMERDPSTAGMNEAISGAQVKWDAKMNRLYQALKKKLPADEWPNLVAAQKAWIVYRDAQIKLLETTYLKMEGTMWLNICNSAVMEITRERALFLEDLIETLSER